MRGVNSTHMQSTIQLRIERTNCTTETPVPFTQNTFESEDDSLRKKWRPTLLRKVRKTYKQIFFALVDLQVRIPLEETYSCFSFFLFFENSSRDGPGEAGQELLLGEFAKIVQICVIMNIFFCFENSICPVDSENLSWTLPKFTSFVSTMAFPVQETFSKQSFFSLCACAGRWRVQVVRGLPRGQRPQAEPHRHPEREGRPGRWTKVSSTRCVSRKKYIIYIYFIYK